MADRKQLARQLYESFSAGDRAFFEEHLADDLVFSSHGGLLRLGPVGPP